jgi:hypothetical protein
LSDLFLFIFYYLILGNGAHSLNRPLTVLRHAQVSPEDAIKVALELKKDLVDQGLLSLTQADLEKHLFRNMELKGYGHIYRERFTMTLK